MEKIKQYVKHYNGVFIVLFFLITVLSSLVIFNSINSYYIAKAADDDGKTATPGKFKILNDNIKNELKDDKLEKVNLNKLASIDGIIDWIVNGGTCFISYSSDGKSETEFCLSTPTPQQQLVNYINRLSPGGFQGLNLNLKTEVTQNNYQYGNTSAVKYGWKLPVNTFYVGENSATIMKEFPINWASTAFMAAGNVVVNFFRNIWSLFDKNCKELPYYAYFNYDTINGIEYATTDYSNDSLGNIKIYAKFLEDNWDTFASEDSLKKMKISEKDEKGIFEEGGRIIKDGEKVGSGTNEISGNTILERLNKEAGTYQAQNIMSAVIEVGKKAGLSLPSTSPVRFMPYSYKLLTNASKDYVKVTDPRVDMFEKYSILPLGIFNTVLKGIVNYISVKYGLNPTSNIVKSASDMNQIANLTFLKNNNVDIFFGWKGGIGTFITLALAILLVVMVFKIGMSILGSMTKGSSMRDNWRRLALTCCFCLLFIGILTNPDGAANFISDTSTKIFNLADRTLDTNDTFKEHHNGQETRQELSELKYWFLYYGAWCGYATGHSLADENANGVNVHKFDPNQGTNEYNGYPSSKASLNGKAMNDWSVILLDSISKLNQTDTASVSEYRAMDHYLSPSMTKEGGNNFTMTANSFFKGKYPYDEIPIGSVLLAIAVWILTFFKLLSFIEFVVDIILLFIKLITSAIQKGPKTKMSEALKVIGLDIIRIIGYETLIMISIWTCFITTGGGLIIMGLLILIAVLVWIFKVLSTNPNNIMCPTLWTWIIKLLIKIAAKFMMILGVIRIIYGIVTGNLKEIRNGLGNIADGDRLSEKADKIKTDKKEQVKNYASGKFGLLSDKIKGKGKELGNKINNKFGITDKIGKLQEKFTNLQGKLEKPRAAISNFGHSAKNKICGAASTIKSHVCNNAVTRAFDRGEWLDKARNIKNSVMDKFPTKDVFNTNYGNKNLTNRVNFNNNINSFNASDELSKLEDKFKEQLSDIEETIEETNKKLDEHLDDRLEPDIKFDRKEKKLFKEVNKTIDSDNKAELNFKNKFGG